MATLAMKNIGRRSGFRSRNVTVWTSLGVILGLAVGWQTAVRADLLKLVDANSTICVQVRGLARHAALLESSEFAKRVTAASFFRDWKQSDAYSQFQNTQDSFKATTGASIRQLVEDILGTDVVIAVHMSTGGEPNAVVLAEGKSSEAVANSIQAWQKLEPRTEMTRTYSNVTYTQTIISGQPGSEVFYVTLGNVIAASEKESMIRRVIELHTRPDAETSIDEVPAAQAALKRRDENEFCSFYINPRAFTVVDNIIPAAYREYWSRMQWLSIRACQYQGKLQCELVVDYDNESMPEWWTKLVQETNQHKLPLDRIPANSLFAVSGHFSSTSVTYLFQTAINNKKIPEDVKQARRVMTGLMAGMDPLQDVLPMIGPTWTIFAVPREIEKSKSFPSDAMIAIALKDVESDDNKKRDRRRAGLDNALQMGLNMLTLIHNTNVKDENAPISTVTQKKHEGVAIKYASRVAMFQPAYAITNDYLMIATSPEMCVDFVKRGKGNGPTKTGEFGFNAKDMQTKAQLVFANTRSIRKMLDDYASWFVWQAKRDRIADNAVRAQMQSLDEFLGLIDGTYLSFGVQPSSLNLSIGAIANPRKPR